jgi:Ca2+ transporting ATPase
MNIFKKLDASKSGLNNQENSFQYEITTSDIREFMQLSGEETISFIKHKYDGVEGLAELLHTNLVTGIKSDEEDVKKRQSVFGANEIPPKPPKLFIQLVFDALTDTTLIILIVCAFVSIGLSFYHPPAEGFNETNVTHEERRFLSLFSVTPTAWLTIDAVLFIENLEWIEGVAIFLAVIVVVLVTALNDWRKERQFRGLQKRIEKDNLTSVVRNGQILQVNVKDLVVGDVCCIKYGDLIPADGLIVQSSDLRIDESSLTGETDLIKKQDKKNINVLSGNCFASIQNAVNHTFQNPSKTQIQGTHVMEGSGRFLVTAVGLNSQTGIIFQLLGATKTQKETRTDRQNNKKSNSRAKPYSFTSCFFSNYYFSTLALLFFETLHFPNFNVGSIRGKSRVGDKRKAKYKIANTIGATEQTQQTCNSNRICW